MDGNLKHFRVTIVQFFVLFEVIRDCKCAFMILAVLGNEKRDNSNDNKREKKQNGRIRVRKMQ